MRRHRACHHEANSGRSRAPYAHDIYVGFFSSSHCSGQTSLSQSLAFSVPPPEPQHGVPVRLHPPRTCGLAERLGVMMAGGRRSAVTISAHHRCYHHHGPRGGTARSRIRDGAVAVRLAPSLSASASSHVNAATVPMESKRAAAWLSCRWNFP
ncbi:hypothetical protein PVAP13_3KG409802 [Panicum virgatum]|uniref:Uncharacterized protein n=1 Tax=Panicum virgatum TaxID=38727 RepID=A0A8T0UXY5_PANVG|nr:hypothetical protein PVAP13_3KG409802 [Panicum virgatum]